MPARCCSWRQRRSRSAPGGGFLPLLPAFAGIVWRLLDEERFLLRNLPGYADYCRTTRYRLVPAI
jgi:protein-S-isoprenylcysteine O-methyltransferase Ste14